MDIRLQFSITPDDYYEFQMAWMKHQRSLTPASQRGWHSPYTVVRLVLMGVVMVMLIVVCISGISEAPAPAAAPPPPEPLSHVLLNILPYVLLFGLVLGVFLWMRRSRFFYRRLAPQGARVNQPKTVEITDRQITIREVGCVSMMDWTYFIRFIETPTQFLLFQTPRLATILPKRAFMQEQLAEFRTFAQAHVGNQPVGFPVQPPPLPSTHVASAVEPREHS